MAFIEGKLGYSHQWEQFENEGNEDAAIDDIGHDLLDAFVWRKSVVEHQDYQRHNDDDDYRDENGDKCVHAVPLLEQRARAPVVPHTTFC